jgi:hypothetical protein
LETSCSKMCTESTVPQPTMCRRFHLPRIFVGAFAGPTVERRTLHEQLP